MPDPLMNTPAPETAPPTPALMTTPTTPYQASTATASNATSTGYTPKAFEVAPNATVASQLKDIIAKGSPLMEQARAIALEGASSRGLLNSSMAVGAGHSAVIGSALPIAQADAATWDRAATNTTQSENQALMFGADASNRAGLQNAAAQTQTSQFNAGQENASQAQAQQLDVQKGSAVLQADTAKYTANLQATVQKFIAGLQADTSLTLADKQAASAREIQLIQKDTQLSVADKTAATQRFIAELQASTTITTEQARNLTQQAIATLQADTTLTVEQQKVEAQKLIASMNNTTTLQQQALVNQGSLDNIKAKGFVDTQLTQITEQYKQLLQTNQSASNLYAQTLQGITTIWNNPTHSLEMKAQAANGLIAMMNDGMAAISAISSTPNVQTNLNFSGPINQAPYATPTVTPSVTPTPGVTGATVPNITNPFQQGVTQQAITDAYKSILGREPDAGGLSYYLSSGLSMQQIQAELAANKQADQARIAGITDAYRTILGREPDAGGLAYYINSGMSVDQIRANLAANKAQDPLAPGRV